MFPQMEYIIDMSTNFYSTKKWKPFLICTEMHITLSKYQPGGGFQLNVCNSFKGDNVLCRDLIINFLFQNCVYSDFAILLYISYCVIIGNDKMIIVSYSFLAGLAFGLSNYFPSYSYSMLAELIITQAIHGQ